MRSNYCELHYRSRLKKIKFPDRKKSVLTRQWLDAPSPTAVWPIRLPEAGLNSQLRKEKNAVPEFQQPC